MRPNCEGTDPDFWYFEGKPKGGNQNSKGKFNPADIAQGVEALRLCSQCLFINKCEKITFESLDSIKYGISAGLLPNEKREITGLSNGDVSKPYYTKVREQATEQGIALPDMTPRLKPEPTYDIEEWIYNRRRLLRDYQG